MKTILFDFDSTVLPGTLYPYENGYERHVKAQQFAFMVDVLKVPEAEVRQVHAKLFAQTNQTLKALRTVGGFKFDINQYFEKTRAGYEAFLKPDPGVRALLEALPHKNVCVFTNADEASAQRGLEALEIAPFFRRVFGAVFMGEHCKPDHEAFEQVVKAAGGSFSETVFFDDSLRNIRAAKELGITTVYVANRSTPREVWDVPEVHAVADYVVPFATFDEVHSVFPELFGSSTA